MRVKEKSGRFPVGIGIAIAIVAGLLVAGIAGYFAFAGKKPDAAAQLDEKLQFGMEELKARLPQKMDTITSLIDAKAENGTLSYIYEINDESTRIDFGVIGEKLASVICTDEKMTSLVKDGATYAYEYYNTAQPKKLLGEVRISSCPGTPAP